MKDWRLTENEWWAASIRWPDDNAITRYLKWRQWQKEVQRGEA